MARSPGKVEPGQDRSRGHPSVEEVPGGHQTPSAVASRAGQYYDRFGLIKADGKLGQASPGILHHLGQLDVKLVDHHSIHLPHLVAGQERDALDWEGGPGLHGGDVTHPPPVVVITASSKAWK